MEDKTIFNALTADHEIQRDLMRALLDTEGQSEDREQHYGKLKRELKAHAAAEERCFYVPLIAEDLTQDKARHSVAEHHQLGELVASLDDVDMASSGWLLKARQLFERLEHHLSEEEHEVFQLAGKVLTDTQKFTLARQYFKEIEDQRSERAR